MSDCLSSSNKSTLNQERFLPLKDRLKSPFSPLPTNLNSAGNRAGIQEDESDMEERILPVIPVFTFMNQGVNQKQSFLLVGQ